jgi:serine-type D-Ala-D-Ala carboxypeptidase (penicillin-binding protein 5/6)
MRRRYRRNRSYGSFWAGFILILLIGGIAANYLRPLPKAVASNATITSEISAVDLAWPPGTSSAIGAHGFGALATKGSKGPRPTASIAKVITALAVLEKMPLQKGQQGPMITITKADVELYNKYYRINGSTVKVVEGEQISQYQALQAVLLPSANNMADTLAIWAFGSMDAYHQHANKMVKKLGMTNTIVAADASGMSPATKSTTSDLITLGEAALDNPVVAEVVAQKSAVIPVAGAIHSANARLGLNNIIGIKTGLTDEAGGCFLFAAKHTLKTGQEITIIGVVLGAQKFTDALNSSEPLLNSAKKHFNVKTPIKAGESFASLTTPWLSASEQGKTVVAQKDVTLVAWDGVALTPDIKLNNITHALPAGAQVGEIVVSSGKNSASTPLVLKESISGPTIWWRLSRYN